MLDKLNNLCYNIGVKRKRGKDMRTTLFKYRCKDGYEYIGANFLDKKVWANLTYKHGGIVTKVVYGTFGRY